ncbi:MAG: DUF4124 domain-containing protein [Pseudomonadota bacterium]
MKTVFAICGLLVAAAASANAYRWVDENGVVHYSDRPREGAEQIELETNDPVELRSLTTDDSQAPPADAAPGTAAPQAAPTPAATTTEYERLEIIRPQQGETLWNIGAVATVSLRLTPSLAPNHRLYLVYDGIRVDGLPNDSLDIELPEVFRGEHTLRAQVEDVNGNIIQQSSIRRFFVQQSVIRR